MSTILLLMLAIGSIVAAVIAFTVFHAATSEFNDVITNWETPPITDFYFTSTSTCESGYTALKTPTWPGTYSGACACANGAYSNAEGEYQVSSAFGSCDVNQTDAGCVSQPAIGAIELDEWHKSTICYKQEGAPQLLSATKERPAAKNNAECAAGYSACGSGSTAGDRTTCVKSTQTKCPLTNLEATTTADGGATAPSGFSLGHATVDKNTTWWYADAVTTSGFMPIVEMKLALYDPTGKRGECFQDETKQHKYTSSADSYDYTNNYPSECGRVDKRWELLESQTEAEFLWSNFRDENECSGSSMGETADYLADGSIRCDGGANTYFTDSNCQVADGTSGTSASFGTAGCGSSDTVCKNVMYQSNCGALRRWASQGSEHWAVLFRREIYWKPTCDVSKVDLKAIQQPVEDAASTLLANMIVCIIVNLVIGIFFPVCFMMNLHYNDVPCIPNDGDDEKQLIDYIKKYLGLLFHVVKVIPAIVALSTFATISGALNRAATSGCQDDDDVRTYQTFETMSEQVETSNAAIFTQAISDLFAVFVVLATTLLEHILAARAEKEAKPQAEAEAELSSYEKPGLV